MSILTRRTGKRGRVQVTISSVVYILQMRKWTTTEKGDKVDTSGFENAGFTALLIGLRECEFSFEAIWDAAVNLQDDPPGLYVRHNLTNLVLFLDSVDGTNYTFPLAAILTAAFTVAPREALVYSITGCNQGIYSITTGSFTGNQAPNFFTS